MIKTDVSRSVAEDLFHRFQKISAQACREIALTTPGDMAVGAHREAVAVRDLEGERPVAEDIVDLAAEADLDDAILGVQGSRGICGLRESAAVRAAFQDRHVVLPEGVSAWGVRPHRPVRSVF